MHYKERLQDYTLEEFNAFVQAIWAVDVPGVEHDRLIAHFDRVVGHPRGADLLFYPDHSQLIGGAHGSDAVSILVRNELYAAGRQSFREEAVPGPVSGAVPRSRGERDLQEARSESQALEVQCKVALATLERYTGKLDAFERAAPVDTGQPLPRASFDQAARDLDTLDKTRSELVRALRFYDRQGERLEFSLKLRQNGYVAPQDKAVHATLLKVLGDACAGYRQWQKTFEQRHADLHPRSEALLGRGRDRLVAIARAARCGPLHDRQTFVASLADVGRHPRLLALQARRFQAFDEQWPALGRAVRSAVAGLIWETGAQGGVQHAAVMDFTDQHPGCGDALALSVPLRELMPTEGHDWWLLAMTQGEVELPQRVLHTRLPMRSGRSWDGLREIKEQASACVLRTGEGGVSRRVKVRMAVRDAAAWRLSCADGRPREVLWYEPAAWAQRMQASVRDSQVGSFSVAGVPQVEKVDPTSVHLDDYVVVFAPDSGIEPVYLSFKPRSEYPGLARGQGQTVAAGWLTGAGVSYPVPVQVARQLVGQVFDRFSHLLAAFWKAVAAEPELSSAFSARDREAMARGNPGSLAGRLRIGFARRPLNGGDVYDLDNLTITRR